MFIGSCACISRIGILIFSKVIDQTIMMQSNELWVEVDEKGRLVLPPEVAERYGMQAGAQMFLREGSKGLQLQRPITQLAKVYIEPTSRCNLTCKTCIRNAWDESQGDMADETFELVLQYLEALPYRPTLFFGGFGEPLLLANIAEMITKAKKVAGKVELITNGILLTESCARKLIESGLDTLWVSVDGVTPESYADIRIGAELPKVLENIRRLAFMRHKTNRRPEIGIAFVAMRKNIGDLPALIKKGPSLGVSRFMVTNVFPYTKEMCGEMLDVFSVDSFESRSSPWTPHIDLPRMDMNETSQEAIFRTLRNRHNVRMNGVSLGQEHGRCPFIEKCP